MIDINFAREEFWHYLKMFDTGNEKIKLKKIHTEGVVCCAAEIAHRMALSEEDCRLAELIALLHDIGRFEQIRLFDSFEAAAMDHAAFGVDLLFGKTKMIRRFVKEDTWDSIIREAIARHSDFSVGVIKDMRTMRHAQLIRDADKLDNCRVKLEDSVGVLLGQEAEAVGEQEISQEVWETCLSRKAVRSADRKTKMDYWVSYLAYFFDVNFSETYSLIQEKQYVDRIIDRIPYTNETTRDRMEKLRRILLAYISSKIKNNL